MQQMIIFIISWVFSWLFSLQNTNKFWKMAIITFHGQIFCIISQQQKKAANTLTPNVETTFRLAFFHNFCLTKAKQFIIKIAALY